MVGDVAEELHTFFVPQIEQLGLVERPVRHGSLSKLHDERGTGILWAQSIGPHCLFTFHDMELYEPIDLVEFPSEYTCIASMSSCSARICPVEASHLHSRNILSFHQYGGPVRCALKPGERHRTFSLCMTPDFFDQLSGIGDAEKERLVDYLHTCSVNLHPYEIMRALESMEPSWATREGGGMFCEGKVKEILAYSLSAAMDRGHRDPSDNAHEDKRIAHEAQLIIDERFADKLTLHSIASELYVGKTRLCAVFREQLGSGIAEYLRERRMSEARRLLETTKMKTAEVGHAVGYAHASSFADAFRREFGMSPSEWRQLKHRQGGT